MKSVQSTEDFICARHPEVMAVILPIHLRCCGIAWRTLEHFEDEEIRGSSKVVAFFDLHPADLWSEACGRGNGG